MTSYFCIPVPYNEKDILFWWLMSTYLWIFQFSFCYSSLVSFHCGKSRYLMFSVLNLLRCVLSLNTWFTSDNIPCEYFLWQVHSFLKWPMVLFMFSVSCWSYVWMFYSLVLRNSSIVVLMSSSPSRFFFFWSVQQMFNQGFYNESVLNLKDIHVC